MFDPKNNPHKDARILLVDDFEMIRMMLKNSLQSLGFTRIDEAVNGNDALFKMKDAFAKQDPYAFVFCDWNMPEKDGMEVLKECRGNPNLRHTPFVMVTAESEQEKVVQALKAGAVDYIVKPIAPAILQKKVAKLLSIVGAA